MALVNVVNMVGVPESIEAKNAIEFVRMSSRELTCAVIGSPFLLSRSVLEYRLKITLGGGQAINVLDNPSPFCNPFQFEITFECLQELEDDLEWKVVYVGSAEDMTHDQVLDEILVGPVPVGVNKFVLQADAPDSSCIPNGDIIGVTVVLVTCSYKEREFVRVGYYVNNEYAEEYDPEVGPPTPIDLNKVVRTILADKPRVTRFPISWDGKDEVNQQQQHGVAEEESPMEEGGGDDFIVGDSINGIADGDLEEDEDADDLVGMEEEDMNE